ncbi:MAG: hypothetical protein K2K38_06285, partial [Clostridia bacterium]|nr:hypothetical protein [Clostridia bacterium]
CTIVKVCKTAREIVNLPDETYKIIEETAKNADGHKLLRVTEILSKAETDMRYSLSGRITLETAVLKASMPQSDYDIDALIGKINALERKLSEGITVKTTVEKPVQPAKPVAEVKKEQIQPAKKIVLKEDGFDPFAKKEESAHQAQIFDNAPVTGATSFGSADKGKVFAKFIKALRTTRKNAVLFTLCMDLDHTFEGDKLILFTESEAVLKSLNRADNFKFISEVLLELGVTDFEVRFKEKGESGYEKALKELKSNFDGTDIEIK